MRNHHHAPAESNAPSLNEPNAPVTHFEYASESPLCGFTETDGDGYSATWAGVDCANCIEAR